jgi:hypothetical protein
MFNNNSAARLSSDPQLVLQTARPANRIFDGINKMHIISELLTLCFEFFSSDGSVRSGDAITDDRSGEKQESFSSETVGYPILLTVR